MKTRPRRHSYLRPTGRRHAYAHQAAAGSLSPPAVFAAYRFPKLAAAADPLLGVVTLGGALDPQDLAAAFRAWGLPAPTVSPLAVDGAGPSPDPGGADVELALDVELAAAAYSYCTGRAARVAVCYAPNDGTGIAHAVSALVAAGCKKISISWGAPDDAAHWPDADRAATEAALRAAVAAGATVCVASGDNSIDDGTSAPTCDYPCGSAFAWAVGGTRLTLNADGTLAAESAWGDGRPGDPGGGGGLDPRTPKPAWQGGAVPGPSRGCPDSSGNADPATGWQVFVGGAWTVVGGTSASAPMTAGLFAALEASGLAFGHPGALLYGARGAFRDVTTGSDGAPAAPGWDEATGLGSPDGPGLLAALRGQGGGPPPPPPPPPPPAPTRLFSLTFARPVPKGGVVQFRAPAALAPGTYDVTGRPAGAHVVLAE